MEYCLVKDRNNCVFIAFKNTLVKLKLKYNCCIGSVNLITSIITAWCKIKIFEVVNFSSFGFHFVLNNDTPSRSICSRKECVYKVYHSMAISFSNGNVICGYLRTA